jgi:arsenate reductase-like glutaredoxin family protein
MDMRNFISYGYNQSEIEIIKEGMQNIFRNNFSIISMDENSTILDNLKNRKNDFTEQETKVLMLSGFSDKDVDKTLQNFPKTIKRPIFCLETKHNINWTFEKLLNDLLEEQTYFKNQGK